jgi:hypothetical protein
MNRFWIAATAMCLLAMGAVAQTSASGSASGNASVTPGQASAGANASQSAQTPGASANADASANAKASHEQESSKKDKDSGSQSSGSKASTSGAGNAVAGVDGSHGALSSGTTLQAELSKSIDAKKAKPGDEVTAKLTQDVKTDGKVVLHKGSKLVGHVTEAQEKNKENAESKLGMVFDKAILKGGQEVAFNGMIQALAPPAQGATSIAGDESSSLGSGMGSGSGSSMGGGRSGGGGIAPIGAATSAAGGAVGGAASSVTNSVGATRGAATAAANGTFNAASRGVVGMQGVALNTAAAGSARGSVLSSPSHTIKLDSGTQLILQVAGSAAAQ